MTNKELDELRLKFITARLEGKVIQFRDDCPYSTIDWIDCLDNSSTPHMHPDLCRIKPAEVVYVVMIVPRTSGGEYIDEIFKNLESATKYVETNRDVELDIREIEINS